MSTNAAKMWTLARQQGRVVHVFPNSGDAGFTLNVLPGPGLITVTAGEISGLANAAAGRALMKSKLASSGVLVPHG